MKPIIAIIGRPNVGKSTIFNRMVGKRQALVDDAPGVTRDRQYGSADWAGHEFIVVDTGGIVSDPSHSIESAIKKQTLAAMEEADLLVAIFDGKEGPTHTDQHIVDLLRKSKKPVIFVVNKTDNKKFDISPFYELGLSEDSKIFSISAEHGINFDELLDAAISELSKIFSSDEGLLEETSENRPPRVAVIGRPNVGKSTLVNRLLGTERVIAHDMPGTTRDSIDVEIESGGKKYIFVDTAGIKSKGKTIEALDKFSAIKTLRAIERSDIVLIIIDTEIGVTHQDSSLIEFAYNEGKGVIVAMNKWDTVEKAKIKEYEEFFSSKLLKLHRVPFLCISALKGQGVKEIFPTIGKVSRAMRHRFTTAELNDILEDVKTSHNIPAYKGKAVKLNYATQVDTVPPLFVIFTNFPEGIPESYRRYLVNKLQDILGEGIPIRIKFKKKN